MRKLHRLLYRHVKLVVQNSKLVSNQSAKYSRYQYHLPSWPVNPRVPEGHEGDAGHEADFGQDITRQDYELVI